MRGVTTDELIFLFSLGVAAGVLLTFLAIEAIYGGSSDDHNDRGNYDL